LNLNSSGRNEPSGNLDRLEDLIFIIGLSPIGKEEMKRNSPKRKQLCLSEKSPIGRMGPAFIFKLGKHVGH